MSKITTVVAPPAPAMNSKLRGALVYAAMIAGSVVIFLWISSVGERIQPVAGEISSSVARATEEGEVDVVFHVLATLSAIIVLGVVLSRVLRWFGQPPVIGEVMAGLILGPSVLGALSPSLAHLLVPAEDIDPTGIVPAALRAISRLGIVPYMFLVGMELDLGQLRRQAHSAVAISHASIVVPFLLGSGLALWIYPHVSSPDVSFLSFSLFMGVAMAITAFPVLARILTDQKLEKTNLGVLALSCAATDDVTAWCLLAFVIGIAQAQVSSAVNVLAGAAIYITVMFLIVRPVAEKIIKRFGKDEIPPWAVPSLLVAMLLSALTTKQIGIHSLFGGFVMGLIMPHEGRLATELRSKLHDIATILLLPAFFAITGLRTRIDLLGSSHEWVMAGVIILVATVGKVGGTMAAARLTGISWRDSTALGMLMNSRGLMELIVLNVGLEQGIISPKLFAMMVLMALVTTLMTAPVLRWLAPRPAPSAA